MKTNLHLLPLGILLSLAGASFGQPVITTQPQSSTDISGTTATLWVAATGTPPLAYLWQKLSGTWSDLAGSTDTNLSISNVQTSHAGKLQGKIPCALGRNSRRISHPSRNLLRNAVNGSSRKMKSGTSDRRRKSNGPLTYDGLIEISTS